MGADGEDSLLGSSSLGMLLDLLDERSKFLRRGRTFLLLLSSLSMMCMAVVSQAHALW